MYPVPPPFALINFQIVPVVFAQGQPWTVILKPMPHWDYKHVPPPRATCLDGVLLTFCQDWFAIGMSHHAQRFMPILSILFQVLRIC
jgi:hypothetical protein